MKKGEERQGERRRRETKVKPWRVTLEAPLEGRLEGSLEGGGVGVFTTKVDMEALEHLMEPENQEVSLRYILKYSTKCSIIFRLFGKAEKKDHFVASRKRWLESQGKTAKKQERWQDEWHDIKYQGVMAKALPCPERTLKTPMPQQSPPSSRDEESLWVAVEDRRRRRVAFEDTAKGKLRYLEDSEDLKVTVAELQELLGISEEAGVFIRQIAQQVRNENGQKFFLFLGKEKKMYALPVGLDETRSWKVWRSWTKRCQNMRQKVNFLSKR